MTFLCSFFLMLVVTLLSFLPVSASAAIVFLHRFLQMTDDPLLSSACFHFAWAVVLLLLFAGQFGRLLRLLLQMLADVFHNIGIFFLSIFRFEERADTKYKRIRGGKGRRRALFLFLSFFFACFFALLFRAVAARAYHSLFITGFGLFISAIFLFVTELLRKRISGMVRDSVLAALLLGFFVGIAVVPGISFFAMVISACTLLGYSLKQSLRIGCLLFAPLAFSYFIFVLVSGIRGGSVVPANLLLFLFLAIISAVLGLLLFRAKQRHLQEVRLGGYALLSAVLGAVALAYGVWGGIN